jgi:hypothetical protein
MVMQFLHEVGRGPAAGTAIAPRLVVGQEKRLTEGELPGVLKAVNVEPSSI